MLIIYKKVEESGFCGGLNEQVKRILPQRGIFWQQHNKPIELWNEAVIKQKIDYIHQNLVVLGFVVNAEDWKYASAINVQEDDTVLEIDKAGFIFC